jgi:hypothetical protein
MQNNNKKQAKTITKPPQHHKCMQNAYSMYRKQLAGASAGLAGQVEVCTAKQSF